MNTVDTAVVGDCAGRNFERLPGWVCDHLLVWNADFVLVQNGAGNRSVTVQADIQEERALPFDRHRLARRLRIFLAVLEWRKPAASGAHQVHTGALRREAELSFAVGARGERFAVGTFHRAERNQRARQRTARGSIQYHAANLSGLRGATAERGGYQQPVHINRMTQSGAETSSMIN
jgi:hypothetical protein